LTVRFSANIHFAAADVGRTFMSGTCGFATLDIGDRGSDSMFFLHFLGPELIDAVIAELVALRNEMAPPAPVITDSERTCDQANPMTGAWCHLPAPHAGHRDTDGETWALPEPVEPDLCECGPLTGCDSFRSPAAPVKM
jgi:hypothetical protein